VCWEDVGVGRGWNALCQVLFAAAEDRKTPVGIKPAYCSEVAVNHRLDVGLTCVVVDTRHLQKGRKVGQLKGRTERRVVQARTTS
jgi:hypothetical protein